MSIKIAQEVFYKRFLICEYVTGSQVLQEGNNFYQEKKRNMKMKMLHMFSHINPAVKLSKLVKEKNTYCGK